MAEKVVCDKCGAEYTDPDTIKMVKDWLAKDGYAPCPNIDCSGGLEICGTAGEVTG